MTLTRPSCVTLLALYYRGKKHRSISPVRVRILSPVFLLC